MSKSVNKVMLMGHVGQAPTMRNTNGGTLVANVNLATNDRRKVNGNWEDHTEWHTLAAFGRNAEIIRDYVRKGSKIFIEGKLTTRKHEDEHQVTRYYTSVLINDLVLLDGPGQRNGERPAQSEPHDPRNAGPVDDSDCPF